MINPSDILPVSQVQANLPRLIRRTRETRRPIVVTQRGRATAALLDIEEYQRLVEAADQREIWEDIARMEQTLDQEPSYTLEEVRTVLAPYLDPDAKGSV